MSIPDQEHEYPETEDIHTSSEEYANRFKGATGTWLLDVQERIALDMVRSSSPARILDVGGGHGQLTRPLCREGFRIIVLGSSETCRSQIADLVNNETCEFQVGNVIALPYEDKSFDMVICFRLVAHCSQWTRLIDELCRVARRAVILDYPTIQSLNAMAPTLFKAKKKVEKNTRTWRLFKHREILDAFSSNGFQPGSRKAQFFLPIVFHRILKIRFLSVLLEGLFRGVGLTCLAGSPVVVNMIRKDTPPDH